MKSKNALALLESGALERLPVDFTAGGPFEPRPVFVAAMHREVDLATLDQLVTRAMEKGASPETDRWLGPRLHCALRLTRAEAADRRLWSYLGVVKYPEYVRARFGKPTEPAPLDRFSGPDAKQALARLWWCAELARNGDDYDDVARALTPQEVPNTALKLRCFRHRPTAIALARICTPELGAEPLPGRKINRLFKQVNTVLTTTVLQAVAPDPGPDQFAIDRWLGGRRLPLEEILEAPRGPAEEPVEGARIAAVIEFARNLGGAEESLA